MNEKDLWNILSEMLDEQRKQTEVLEALVSVIRPSIFLVDKNKIPLSRLHEIVKQSKPGAVIPVSPTELEALKVLPLNVFSLIKEPSDDKK